MRCDSLYLKPVPFTEGQIIQCVKEPGHNFTHKNGLAEWSDEDAYRIFE